ncbi:MAG: ribonuclease P protein component [bacterium]|nr:ribonuclease P protein component [bacterium]
MGIKIFAETFSQGFFASTNLLSLRGKYQKTPAESRFSIVVPTGVTKNKPTRNLLKRRGYTIIRKLLPGLKSKLWAIIFLKKDAKNLTFSDLEAGFIELFQKVKIFK